MSNLYPLPAKALNAETNPLVEGQLVWRAGAGGVGSPQAYDKPFEFIGFITENENGMKDFLQMAYMVEALDGSGWVRDKHFDGEDFLTEASQLDNSYNRNNGYNDHYMFASLEDAQEFVDEMIKIREVTPSIIKAEAAAKRRADEMWEEFDRYIDDFSYDDYGDDDGNTDGR